MSEWPKETGCKPVGESLRRFESFPAHAKFRRIAAGRARLPRGISGGLEPTDWLTARAPDLCLSPSTSFDRRCRSPCRAARRSTVVRPGPAPARRRGASATLGRSRCCDRRPTTASPARRRGRSASQRSLPSPTSSAAAAMVSADPPRCRRRSGRPESRIDRFVTDAAMTGEQAASRYDVDVPPEQGLQVLDEPHLVEKRCLCVEVHEQVDVARWPGLTPGDRTEHPDPRRVPSSGGSEDRVAMVPQQFDRWCGPIHGRSVQGPHPAGWATMVTESIAGPGAGLAWSYGPTVRHGRLDFMGDNGSCACPRAAAHLGQRRVPRRQTSICAPPARLLPYVRTSSGPAPPRRGAPPAVTIPWRKGRGPARRVGDPRVGRLRRCRRRAVTPGPAPRAVGELAVRAVP